MVADLTHDDIGDYGRLLRYLLLPDGGRNYSIAGVLADAARAHVGDGTRPPQWAGEIAVA